MMVVVRDGGMLPSNYIETTYCSQCIALMGLCPAMCDDGQHLSRFGAILWISRVQTLFPHVMCGTLLQGIDGAAHGVDLASALMLLVGATAVYP
jgi:hypothetical protein